MKKVLAVILALCMVCAMGTVAFAATIEGPVTPATGDTLVKTDAELPTDPNVPGGDEDWTVTIPAELTVPWDNENDSTVADVYTLDATLAAVSTVTVTVAPYGTNALTMTDKAGAELKASIGGDESIAQTGTGTVKGDISAMITAAAFNAATVGEYTGTITFTAVYTNTL